METKPTSMSLGKHWIVECHDCDRDLLDDPVRLAPILKEAAELSGATVLETHFHSFEPQGVSGVAIIAESHFTLHSWPEHRYAAIDAFGCGDSLDVEKIIPTLKARLGTEDVVIAGRLNRGILHRERIERVRTLSLDRVDTTNATQSWKEAFEQDQAWGIQTAINLHGCDPEKFCDESFLKKFASDLARSIGATPDGEATLKKSNEGIGLVQFMGDGASVTAHFDTHSNNAYVDVLSRGFYEPYEAGEFCMKACCASDFTLQVNLRM